MPLIEINCAAIPENLVEAELFGYERGAFTDARQSKPGLFQAANRGVLFLDEVGSLPRPVQAKLLTAIEQREVRRLGGTRTEPVDVWIFSATNEDLSAGVARHEFRLDLYHRISAVTLHMPPLRARGRDVIALARHYLERVSTDYGLAPRRLTADAEDALLAHDWPGNVRELANLMERAVLLAGHRGDCRRAPGAPAAARAAASHRRALGRSDMDARPSWRRSRPPSGISRAAARLGVPAHPARIERLGLRPGRRRRT
jgi:transcriptional regulator with GAF, ATPase, and Fis domain